MNLINELQTFQFLSPDEYEPKYLTIEEVNAALLCNHRYWVLDRCGTNLYANLSEAFNFNLIDQVEQLGLVIHWMSIMVILINIAILLHAIEHSFCLLEVKEQQLLQIIHTVISFLAQIAVASS